MKPDQDRSIETLIRLAGEREMPSAAAAERARLAAERSWRRMLDGSTPRARWRRPLAWAAALCVAAVAAWLWPGRDVTATDVLVAQVVAVEGQATLRQKGGGNAVARAARVMSGAELATIGGRVAVSIADALSLRVDENTRLVFDRPDHVTLLQGALYVDSGGLGTGPPLAISTPAGEVRHIGTQFQLRVSGDATRIRVREGRVALSRGAGDETRMVAAGDELAVRGGQDHWRHGLASFGDEWDWSASVATSLQIEDRPLAEFLAWVTREHGWQLHYADEAIQQRTHEIRLHGSLEGLATDAMLERVALVTGIPLEVRDGVLWVGGR
jgi:ferric-dicitrate binding protein FerR (iron transport regulator)